MQAIVIAGGLGTRLRSVVKDVPKPLALVNGRPFLDYLLQYLSIQGVNDVLLSVGYGAEFFYQYVNDVNSSMNIRIVEEKEPLGTGGAVKYALSFAEPDNILVCNGDSLFAVNLREFYSFHTQKKSVFSMALRQVSDISRYGAVEIDKNGRICRFAEKGSSSGRGLINGGVYWIDNSQALFTKYPQKFSLEMDFLEKEVNRLNFYGCQFDEYFIDIGIPEDFQKAQDEFSLLEY